MDNFKIVELSSTFLQYLIHFTENTLGHLRFRYGPQSIKAEYTCINGEIRTQDAMSIVSEKLKGNPIIRS
jgi:hypothetical protein